MVDIEFRKNFHLVDDVVHVTPHPKYMLNSAAAALIENPSGGIAGICAATNGAPFFGRSSISRIRGRGRKRHVCYGGNWRRRAIRYWCNRALSRLLPALRAGEETQNRLSQIEDFTATQTLYGAKGFSLAVDEERLKICVIDRKQKPHSYEVLPCSSILACEIFEDGCSYTTTDRGSQLGGALVGGLAFGGVGALAGGLSGKQNTRPTATRVDLRLTLDDVRRPTIDVALMFGEIDRRDPGFIKILDNARHWEGLLTVLMRRAQGAPAAVAESLAAPLPARVVQNSTADELRKLLDLQREGVLSQAEFDQQKAKLLAGY